MGLRGRLRIAREKPLVWCSLALALLVLGVLYSLASRGEHYPRWLGLALQLVGIYTVFHDLTSIAGSFQRASVLKGIGTWLLEMARSRKAVVEAEVNSTLVMGQSVQLTQRRPIKPNLAIPDRVAALEANFQFVDNELREARQAIDKEGRQRQEEIRAEQEARASAVQDVARRLEGAVAGNYNVLLFGVWWLATGVALATLAPEVTRLAVWLRN